MPYVPLMTYSLNQHMVRRGLATVKNAADMEHMHLVRTRRPYADLTDRLVLAEQVQPETPPSPTTLVTGG